MLNNQITDKYELYSFSIYLYMYFFFYLFIFEQTFIRSIIMNIFGNVFIYYLFNNHIFSFIGHKYWKYNLNQIAMPQLITCATNVIINKYDYTIIVPLNIVSYYFIKNMYRNEISQSKNLRFIIIILFFITKILF